MNSYQDNIRLEETFPFQINEVVLRAEDNVDDVFHWHTYFEITHILSGAGVYYANGQSFEVSGGDLIIFNSAELHGWQVLQREMRVLAMVFSADLVAGYGNLGDAEYLKPFIERGSNFKNRIGAGEPYARDIAAIMEEIPETPIYCTANAVKSIEGQYGKRGWDFHVVKTGDTVDVGNRKQLIFIEMRMLHWPDSMAAYLTGDNILFSNDAFGQHYSVEELFNDRAEIGRAHV